MLYTNHFLSITRFIYYPSTDHSSKFRRIESILSIIFYVLYGYVCFQLNHFPFGDCENSFTLSYYHHQNLRCDLLAIGWGKAMKRSYMLYILLCSYGSKRRAICIKLFDFAGYFRCIMIDVTAKPPCDPGEWKWTCSWLHTVKPVCNDHLYNKPYHL